MRLELSHGDIAQFEPDGNVCKRDRNTCYCGHDLSRSPTASRDDCCEENHIQIRIDDEQGSSVGPGPIKGQKQPNAVIVGEVQQRMGCHSSERDNEMIHEWDLSFAA